MRYPREGHTATLLADGRVVVAGGIATVGGDGVVWDTAEVYDPGSGTWSETGRLSEARAGHSAFLLPDGRVLVLGGSDVGGNVVQSMDVYDPGTGRWTATPVPGLRAGAMATLLPDGRVLVVGGLGDAPTYGIVSRVEILDPGSGALRSTASMADPRTDGSVTVLLDGTVLVAGGLARGIDIDGPPPILLSAAEIYDPALGTWRAAASMGQQRAWHTAVRLVSGHVLLVGGSVPGQSQTGSTDLYDPARDAWTPVDSLNLRPSWTTVTALGDGRAVAMTVGSNYALSTEILETAPLRWRITDARSDVHFLGTATLLADGRILVAGGTSAAATAIATAELFDPSVVP